MNGTRKPTFHDARYDRLKDLDSDVRSRPLQSVRRAFFLRPTVVILQWEIPRLQDFRQAFVEIVVPDFRRRIFPIARWERAVFLSDKLWFVRQKRSLCEAGVAPKSRPFFLPILWIPTEN